MNAISRNRWLRFDRMISGSLWRQFTWITCMLIIAWLLSFLFLSLSGTEWQNYCSEHGVKPWLLPLYLLIDTNAYNSLYFSGDPNSTLHGWMLVVSSITYLFGLFIFNGIIISVLSNYFAQRKERYENGTTRYVAFDHYVILGYDEMVPSVIDNIFRKDSDACIFILSAVNSVIIREQLRKSVRREFIDQIVVNYGHRIARDYYPDIHLEKAKEIYVVGKRTLPNHDATNVECVESIFDYLSAQPQGVQIPNRIICVFEDFDTYSAFKVADIFDKARILNIDFVPYNFYVGWAKQLFLDRHYYSVHNDTRHEYPSICCADIGYNDPHYVHLVFVGMSTFAVALALEAAQMLHFPNGTTYAPKGTKHKSIKSKITFIDKNAYSEMQLFRTRNRHFFEIQSCLYYDLKNEGNSGVIKPSKFAGKDSDFLDIEFEFVNGDVFSENAQKMLASWSEDKNQYLSIFLAQSNQRDNFCLSMNMPDVVYDNQVPIYIRQDNSDTFVTQLREAHVEHHQKYSHIYPFGMSDTAFYINDTEKTRAQIINYLYTSSIYTDISIEKLKEEVEKGWRDLPMALKWSSLYSAEMIPVKQKSLDAMKREAALSDEEQIMCMAEVEHNRWSVEKLLMGYRKPSAKEMLVYNNDLKKYHFVHPDIRPYNELGDSIQKDINIAIHISEIIKAASLLENSNA